MYIPKNKYEKHNPEIRDIVVKWDYGAMNGFRSKEDAERYINLVCKKAAPNMDYSISS